MLKPVRVLLRKRIRKEVLGALKQADKENKIIYDEEQGVKKPFILKELLPKVKGVVIVADGAGDIEIKNTGKSYRSPTRSCYS